MAGNEHHVESWMDAIGGGVLSLLSIRVDCWKNRRIGRSADLARNANLLFAHNYGCLVRSNMCTFRSRGIRDRS